MRSNHEVKNMFGEWSWRMLKAVPCSAHHTTLASLCGFRDFSTEGEAEVPDQVDAMITTRFKAKILPRVGPVVSLAGTVLGRKLLWIETGYFLQPEGNW